MSLKSELMTLTAFWKTRGGGNADFKGLNIILAQRKRKVYTCQFMGFLIEKCLYEFISMVELRAKLRLMKRMDNIFGFGGWAIGLFSGLVCRPSSGVWQFARLKQKHLTGVKVSLSTHWFIVFLTGSRNPRERRQRSRQFGDLKTFRVAGFILIPFVTLGKSAIGFPIC